MPARRYRRRVDVLRDHRRGVIPGEWRTACHQFIKHGAEYVEVGLGCDLAAEGRFRWHVGGSPNQRALLGDA